MVETQPITQVASDRTNLILEAIFPQFLPDDLFEHFTQPALLQRWWPAVAIVDAQPGGAYRLSWPELNWVLVGEYTHFEPGRRLGFTWHWEHEPHTPHRHVEITFTPQETGCRLRLVHSAYTPSEADQEERQSHLDGWLHFLAQLHTLSVQTS